MDKIWRIDNPKSELRATFETVVKKTRRERKMFVRKIGKNAGLFSPWTVFSLKYVLFIVRFCMYNLILPEINIIIAFSGKIVK